MQGPFPACCRYDETISQAGPPGMPPGMHAHLPRDWWLSSWEAALQTRRLSKAFALQSPTSNRGQASVVNLGAAKLQMARALCALVAFTPQLSLWFRFSLKCSSAFAPLACIGQCSHDTTGSSTGGGGWGAQAACGGVSSLRHTHRFGRTRVHRLCRGGSKQRSGRLLAHRSSSR